MFFELLVFVFLGMIAGVVVGLIPGIHPNLIVLAIPILLAIDVNPLLLLAFIVTMAVSNSIIDFIPSILLGAPDDGNELSILPGHKMLLAGHGYEAVKLTVIGGVGATVVCSLMLPFLLFLVPFLYGIAKPFIYMLLIVIVLIMVLTETGNKKLIALLVFFLAGLIGLLANKLPINNSLVLFPVLSGLFGVSMLLLQIKSRIKIPEQTGAELNVSRKTVNRSLLSGSFGGIFSGILPGVGSSEIASLASVEKNDHSFLVSIGAITTANILLSMISLYLIGKARSGVAVVIEQTMSIGFNELLMIVSVSLIACGVSAILTLLMTKRFLGVIEQMNYSVISVFVLSLILLLTFVFTSFYGLFLLAICSVLGIFTNIVKIKRGNLMGVLILPTILFYLPV
ncbi:MAG: tripartite tricarboxylate transporter permease [Candidatus Aenigmatarchaeota archaeon]